MTELHKACFHRKWAEKQMPKAIQIFIAIYIEELIVTLTGLKNIC